MSTTAEDEFQAEYRKVFGDERRTYSSGGWLGSIKCMLGYHAERVRPAAFLEEGLAVIECSRCGAILEDDL